MWNGLSAALVELIGLRHRDELARAAVAAIATQAGVRAAACWLAEAAGLRLGAQAGALHAWPEQLPAADGPEVQALVHGLPASVQPLVHARQAAAGLLVVLHHGPPSAADSAALRLFAAQLTALLTRLQADAEHAFEQLFNEAPLPQRAEGRDTATGSLRPADAAGTHERVDQAFAQIHAGHLGHWDLDILRDTSRRSPRHDRCFGYAQPVPETEWGVRRFLDHIHPEDRERVASSMQLAVDSRTEWSADFRVLWADSSLHWLTARGCAYRFEQGRATRMLGIVMDITAQKLADEALRSSEQLARRQVQTLSHTLDVLAAESSPDRLIEHGLRVITEQLQAHSCSIWRQDTAAGTVNYEYGFENGALVTKGDPRLQGFWLQGTAKEMWPWDQVFGAGEPVVFADIAGMRPFPGQDRLLSQGVVAALVIPLSLVTEIDGVIGVRFHQRREFRAEELKLAQALANQAMLALRLTHLSAQGRAAAVIAERNRMAREIHDTLAQGFTGIIVQLEAAADATAQQLPAEAGAHLLRAQQLARDSLKEARRSVRALRPQELEERELAEALEAMIHKTTAGTPVTAEIRIEGQPRKLPAEAEENLLRILQEVLTNVLRHAGASRFEARIAFGLDALHVTLQDNGHGFDTHARHEGFGLIGIGERVAEMHGQWRLESAPGQGATLQVEVPFERP